MVLRVEDLDPARSRPAFVAAILDDLKWLGLDWDERAPDQSCRGEAYEAALEKMNGMGLLYPCSCTRDQLHAASAPHAADGRVIYPGTCRGLTPRQRALQPPTRCLRMRVPGETVGFVDGLQGPVSMDLEAEWGDFIVRRADGVAAYQLAVVVDDAACGITQVVRGRDLLSSTPVQLYLYRILGLQAPAFIHVPMLLSGDGRRLSKRDRALDLGVLRREWPPEKVIGLLAWRCGLIDRWEAVSPRELAADFSWERVRREDIVLEGLPH